MNITRITIDEDRGQVTLVVHDPISDLRWGVFPEPEEQGPQREGESDADYRARLAALVDVLRERALANPAPGAGKPQAVRREIRELVTDPVPLIDRAAVQRLAGTKPADREKLEAFRAERAAEAAEAVVEGGDEVKA